VGWTGFELWAMSLVATEASARVFHHSSYWFWLAVMAVLCTALALGGPILVVRRWLERFGAWVVAAVGMWVTYRLLARVSLGTLWHRPGTGGLPFWLAVDLVVVMPVSWLPLVADYNRFARRDRPSAAGTFCGYAFGNAWFYALGALLVLGAGLSDATPAGLGTAIGSLAGGWVVLVALLVGETDEAFADIYSSAVSVQNLEARIPQRGAVVSIAAAGAALAVWLGLRPHVALGNYEAFLFLMGSVFVPLFGVFVADYFILHGGKARGAEMFETEDGGRPARLNARALVAWIIGFLVYQWCVPVGPSAWQHAMKRLLHSWLRLPFPLARSTTGASIPAFCAALVLYLILWAPRALHPSQREGRATG
jgi:NCS1 family nucleobase:cation symporter-1